MRLIALIPLSALIGAAFSGCLSGCAKGPAGGPVVPAANRLTVNMTLQQAINPQFFYTFAFDDDGDPTDGPGAIIGTTQLTNGVVGGAFTVLVQYRGGQFQVFRRRFVNNNQEILERSTNAFVDTATAAGNTIRFTLNLDARIDVDPDPNIPDDDFLFARNTQQLDVNFVTTSEIIRDPNNLSLKPFDALGELPRAPNQFATFDISSTRTIRNTNTVREPTNDADPGNTNISAQQLAQLDITDFTIDVRRSN